MFLTETELRDLTGYVRPSAQIRWLRTRGYRFEIGGDGLPRLSKNVVIEKLGGVVVEIEEPKPAPLPPYEIEPIEAICARRIPYERDAVPHAQGVYFLFDDDRLVYVGMSNAMRARLFQHRYDDRQFLVVARWWNHAAWCELEGRSRDEVHEIELKYMHLLKPERNIKYR